MKITKIITLALILTISSIILGKKANSSIVTLTAKNHSVLRGTINFSSVAKLQLHMLPKLETYPSAKAYFLVIDSGGGSISAALNLLETLKPFKNIKTICLQCASAAHHIVQAIPNERLILADSLMMAHRARTKVSGQVETGELESRLAMVKYMVRSMEKVNAKRIGISLQKYKAKVVNEWYVFGQQAINQNHADRIIIAKCHKSLYKTKSKEVSTMFGSMQVKESVCPLIPGLIK